MRTTLLLASLALALTLAPPAAAATRGPCIPGGGGPQCTLWNAKVLVVQDGDTIDVRVGGKRQRVRITGMNAMEHTVYANDPRRRRGQCHALEATARTEALIRRGRDNRVRLAAQRASSRSGRRLRRTVYVRTGGQWVNVARTLVSEGHALWLPAKEEWAWNRDYSELAQQAAARGERLWDTDYCDPGPNQDSPLRVDVNWDADGNDKANPEGEWVDVENLDGSREVSVGGWRLRDSDLREYRFPASAAIPAGGSIRLYVADPGNTNSNEFVWGEEAVFENVTDDQRALGDGAYLFDPDGDLRAWQTYPCRVECPAGPQPEPEPDPEEF